MTFRRKRRTQKSDIGSGPVRTAKFFGVMTGGGDQEVVVRRATKEARRQMHAVGAEGAGKVKIDADEEKNAVRAADRGVAPRKRLPVRIVVIAMDDRASRGQCFKDRLRVSDSPSIGEKGEAERRAFGARLFERRGRRC